jgi:hypothetical protein
MDSWPPPLPRLNGADHTIYIFVVLLVIIIAKIAEGRLQMLICASAATILFSQRLNRLTRQLTAIGKGDFTFPSIITLFDSLAIVDLLVVIWGFLLFADFVIHAHFVYSFVDCALLAFLLSQILFLGLAIVHQVLLSFFFPTCIRRGFFLFSILPRFVAGVRTGLVTFLWFDTVRQIAFVIPRALEMVYLVVKLWLFLSWVKEFVGILSMKEFPPEFGTRNENVTCPVCLDSVSFCVELPCAHDFCVPCLCKWGAIQRSCPVCRGEFSSWIHQVELQHLYPISLMIL